jgi:hypothetical protein
MVTVDAQNVNLALPHRLRPNNAQTDQQAENATSVVD